MIRRYGLPGLASAMLLFSVLSLAWGLPRPAQEKEGPEVSPAAAALLKQLNTASEQTLKGSMGLPEGVAAKIIAHRAGGGKFANLLEVRSVTKMSTQDLERLLMPFEEAEAQRSFEAQRKPVPDPAQPSKAGGRLQRSAASGEKAAPAGAADAAPVQTGDGKGPITSVRPGFYGKLPGYEDLDKIDPVKRTEFLETVNREFCTCGCKNETVAFCLVNDPSCPVVKSRAKKIYDDIMNKPAH